MLDIKYCNHPPKKKSFKGVIEYKTFGEIVVEFMVFLCYNNQVSRYENDNNT